MSLFIISYFYMDRVTETNSAINTPLPDEWIERIFLRFEQIFKKSKHGFLGLGTAVRTSVLAQWPGKRDLCHPSRTVGLKAQSAQITDSERTEPIKTRWSSIDRVLSVDWMSHWHAYFALSRAVLSAEQKLAARCWTPIWKFFAIILTKCHFNFS